MAFPWDLFWGRVNEQFFHFKTNNLGREIIIMKEENQASQPQVKSSESVSHSVMSDSLWPHGL